MTITELSLGCLRYLRTPAKDYSHDTVISYEAAHRQFVSFLTRDLHLRDEVLHFTAEHVQDFVMAATQRGLKASTIHARLHALSALAQYGMKVKGEHGRYLMTADPTKTFDWPATLPVERPFLSAEQARAFFAVPCEPHEAYLREFLFETGLRATQASRLTVGDLHDVDGTLVVRTTLKGRRGSARHKDLPVSAALARHTWDWLLSRRISSVSEHAETPLLTDAAGVRLRRRDLYQITTRLGRSAGIPFAVGPHTLRHTMSYLMERAEIRPATQSRLLTHDNPTSIRSYRHFPLADLVQARLRQRESMEQFLGYPTPAPACEHEIVSLIAGPQGRQHVCATCGLPFGALMQPARNPGGAT